jgi:hypothetical protein
MANVTKVISTPVTRHPIDIARYPVLKQLPLAEPLTDRLEELPIDVLIGSDYYYHFVKQEAVIQCEDGPVLVGSKFGFLTAGTMCVENEGNPENTVVLLAESSTTRKWKDGAVYVTNGERVVSSSQDNLSSLSAPLDAHAKRITARCSLAGNCVVVGSIPTKCQISRKVAEVYTVPARAHKIPRQKEVRPGGRTGEVSSHVNSRKS